MGAEVVGVDASKFMVKICKKNKLNAVHSVFNFKESFNVKKKFGQADVVIANNVFNHSNDPNNFLKGVKNILKKMDYLYLSSQILLLVLCLLNLIKYIMSMYHTLLQKYQIHIKSK